MADREDISRDVDMNDVFEGTPNRVPLSLADRHAYKKDPGSSDTARTEDTIKT